MTCLRLPLLLLGFISLFSNALAVALSLPASSRPLLAPLQQPTRPVVNEWNPFEEDGSCEIVEEASVDHILKESPLTRAMEIAGILSSKVVVPLSSSVVTDGMAQDWEEFWARTYQGQSNGERLTRALEELGPVYVKFGQALAARPDAIPLSLANSLVKLQDCMMPFDADAAQRIVTQELFQSPKNPNNLTAQDKQSLIECLRGPRKFRQTNIIHCPFTYKLTSSLF